MWHFLFLFFHNLKLLHTLSPLEHIHLTFGLTDTDSRLTNEEIKFLHDAAIKVCVMAISRRGAIQPPFTDKRGVKAKGGTACVNGGSTQRREQPEFSVATVPGVEALCTQEALGACSP